MIVDAEMGMPLDLSRWECLWEGGDVDDSGVWNCMSLLLLIRLLEFGWIISFESGSK